MKGGARSLSTIFPRRIERRGSEQDTAGNSVLYACGHRVSVSESDSARIRAEYVVGKEYRITTDTFLEMIPLMKPTLNEDIIREFEQDCIDYTRY